MSPETQILCLELAQVLEYPDGHYLQRVKKVRQMLAARAEGEKYKMSRFSDFVSHARIDALEELYVQTFDVQSICCLDVGYVMFGEDYRRGQFMAQLKILENKYAVQCGSELPDFLPNILRLLPALKYEECCSLIEKIVGPAMEKMLAGFATGGNVFQEPLAVLRDLLQEEYGG